MASGMEYMLKSMLGVDPDDIKRGALEMQQALQTMLANYKRDQQENRVIMARIEAKLDMLILERQKEAPVIMSDEQYRALYIGSRVETIGISPIGGTTLSNGANNA